jgi:hypothetical protein
VALDIKETTDKMVHFKVAMDKEAIDLTQITLTLIATIIIIMIITHNNPIDLLPQLLAKLTDQLQQQQELRQQKQLHADLRLIQLDHQALQTQQVQDMAI